MQPTLCRAHPFIYLQNNDMFLFACSNSSSMIALAFRRRILGASVKARHVHSCTDSEVLDVC